MKMAIGAALPGGPNVGDPFQAVLYKYATDMNAYLLGKWYA